MTVPDDWTWIKSFAAAQQYKYEDEELAIQSFGQAFANVSLDSDRRFVVTEALQMCYFQELPLPRWLIDYCNEIAEEVNSESLYIYCMYLAVAISRGEFLWAAQSLSISLAWSKCAEWSNSTLEELSQVPYLLGLSGTNAGRFLNHLNVESQNLLTLCAAVGAMLRIASNIAHPLDDMQRVFSVLKNYPTLSSPARDLQSMRGSRISLGFGFKDVIIHAFRLALLRKHVSFLSSHLVVGILQTSPMVIQAIRARVTKSVIQDAERALESVISCYSVSEAIVLATKHSEQLGKASVSVENVFVLCASELGLASLLRVDSSEWDKVTCELLG